MQFIARAADGGEIVCPCSTEAAQGLIPQLLKTGVQVFVKFQVANRHAVDAQATPDSTALRCAVTKSRAHTASTLRRSEGRRRPGGYHPSWVRAQLVLGLRLLGWVTEMEYFRHPGTGEILPPEASALELIELMVCRSVGIERRDPLLELGEALGAVVRRLS
jgi:hypothetical protein